MSVWLKRFLVAVVSAVMISTPQAGLSSEAEPVEARQGTVNFSFDRVEIRLLVQLVGEMTGRRFVLDETVKGKVTVVSPPRIPLDEVYPLFLSILEASGYTVLEQEDISRIVPLPKSEAVAGRVTVDGDDGAGLVTRVFRLEHVNAVELKRTLEPMIRGGKAGALAAFGPTNHLIVTDTAEQVRRLAALIEQLDTAGAARTVEVVALKHASAEDVAAQIREAMQGAESAGKRLSRRVRNVAEGGAALPSEVVIVSANHANSILLVGTGPEIREMKRIVEMLDRGDMAERGPLNAIFLNYLGAEEAAKSLTALLEKSVQKEERQRVAIEPDIANNALLVLASPRDFEWVKDLVEQLDRVPQQVLVEILIVEVTLGKELDLGVEWSTIDEVADGRTTVVGRSRPGETDNLMNYITQGIFPQGIALGVARGTYEDANGNIQPNVPFLIRALSGDRDVNILSSVPLWAQNNTEASVSVVDNIPLLKSTIQGGSGTARDVIQNIERVDVGIKLTITPHVNPDGEVSLDLNPSIEAIIDEGPADTQFTPTIAKREVSTTVTVPDRATIAISGLIREDRVKAVSKVPLLGDIPLLGMLFRSTSEDKQRTNLMIFVTPHVVTDMDAAEEMKRSWEEKTGLNAEELEGGVLSGKKD
jgi:general secretion pathway protein D